MFVCLDVHNEHQSVVVLNLLHGRLCRQGELDDGIVVQPGREDNWWGPELVATATDCGLWIGCISSSELESSLVILWSLKPSCAPTREDLQQRFFNSIIIMYNLSSTLLAATHLFLRGALLRGYLGCRLRRRVLGRRKVGVVLIFFFLWLWTPLSTAFFAFRALDLASVLAGTAKKGRTYCKTKQQYNIQIKLQDLRIQLQEKKKVKSSRNNEDHV